MIYPVGVGFFGKHSCRERIAASLALLFLSGVVSLRGATDSFFGIDSSNSIVNLAEATGAARFYSNGIYGQNVTAWVVDAQLAGTNLFPALGFTNLAQTFVPAGVVTDPGNHATWCAALLGAYASPGYYVNTGLAPGVSMGSAALASSLNPDGSFDLTTNSLTAYTYAAARADVLSTSVGDSSDTAGTGTMSGQLDSLARLHPNTTMVAAAGNNGPANGTVGGPASGYNVVSVGALDGPTNYSTVASFSSRGPLQTAWYDGTNTRTYAGGIASRAGVDLLAPGSNLVMPAVIGSNSVSYYSIAGTSFATPLVAGGAALLDSTAKTYFDASVTNAATRSEVIKAVLMNSADKLPGWDNGQRIAAGVITTTQALDWAMGAGRMNLNAAFSQYTTSAVITSGSGITQTGFTALIQSAGWAFGTASLGGHNDYQFLNQLLNGQQLSVTLAWMRDRTWNADIADYADVAQAELDLMIYRITPGGEQLVAQSISPVGTVQELSFLVGDPGTYDIRVGYSTNLFDLSGSYSLQEYGLAWSAQSVPEPSDWALLVTGAVVWVLRFRKSALRTG
jgi:Subtilase family